MFLGGSPLRLFRISERARGVIDALAHGRAGREPGGHRALLARRLVSAGAFAPDTRSSARTTAPTSPWSFPSVTGRRQLDRLLDPPRGVALRRRRRRLERCRRHQRDLRAARRAIRRSRRERRSGGARNQRARTGRDAGGGVRRLRLRAARRTGWNHCWLISTIRWWPRSRRASCRRHATRRPSSPATRQCGPPSTAAARAGPVRPGSGVPFVPSAVLVVRTDGGRRARALRSATAERRGRRPGVAPGRGRLGRPLRTGQRGRRTTAQRPSAPSSADGVFYGTSAGPLALRHGDAMAPVQASGWSVAVWLLGLLRRPGLAMAAQATSIVVLAQRLRGLVRDPVAVATKIAGGGTARAAVPALAGHGSGLVAPLRRWDCSSAARDGWRRWPCSCPRCATVPRQPGNLDVARYVGPPRRGRCRLRGRRLGRLPPSADGHAAAAHGSPGVRGPGRRRASASNLQDARTGERETSAAQAERAIGARHAPRAASRPTRAAFSRGGGLATPRSGNPRRR